MPGGSTVTNGDTSDSTDVNSPLGDIVSDLNAARPIVAGGTGATSASAALTALGAVSAANIAVNVKDYGAVGNGVADDTDAFNDALAAGSDIYIPAGTYNIDGVAIPADSKTLRGAGNRATILNVTTAAPGYGISLASFDYITLEDLRIQGSGANTVAGRTQLLITTGGDSFFNRFTRVWFGPSDEALTVTNDFYWATFTDCVFRDNDHGVVSETAEDFNAVTFTGCTFYHFEADAAGVGQAVYIDGSDGITFQGCQIQNQGIFLNDAFGVSWTGGYVEALTAPAFVLTGTTEMHFEKFAFIAGTIFSADEAAAAGISGYAPDGVISKDGTAVEFINSGGNRAQLMPAPVNYFPDPSCSTAAAVDAAWTSPTGVQGTESINGSSNLEISFTSLQRNAFSLTGQNAITVYARWRVTAGTARVALDETVVSHGDTIDSATDTDWRYYRATSIWDGTGVGPAVIFSPVSATATIEIDSLIVASGEGYIDDFTSNLKLAQLDDLQADTATIGALTGDTIQLGTNGLFQQFAGGTVSVPDSAATTVYTFPASGTGGFWFVTIDLGGFIRSDQAFWSGIIAVGTNTTLTISETARVNATATGAGLALQLTQTSGSTRNFIARGVLIGSLS